MQELRVCDIFLIIIVIHEGAPHCIAYCLVSCLFHSFYIATLLLGALCKLALKEGNKQTIRSINK